jgi:hypothetical protein
MPWQQREFAAEAVLNVGHRIEQRGTIAHKLCSPA